MRKIILAACGLLTATLSIRGQTSPSKPKSVPPKSTKWSVYFD
ncbi:MAG TPA: hypothetical protein VK709_19210 [Candidatus Saccharimonadales bacterium]|nr:hypothetical protein [Candidatus Saccharimonadales bacterium]